MKKWIQQYKQFKDNYRIWKKYKSTYRQGGHTYEKGDIKFELYRFIRYLIPALIWFAITVYIIINL